MNNIEFTPADAAKLGAIFINKIRAELTQKEWRQVCKRNQKEKDPLCCHTHDFVDANEYMLEAYTEFMRTERGIEFEGIPQDFTLWNAGWDYAKTQMVSIDYRSKI